MMKFGPTIAPIMILHGAPTDKDVEENKPYQDLIGATYKRIATDSGLELHNCLTTYVTDEPHNSFSLTRQYTVKKTKVDKDRYPHQLFHAHVTPEIHEGVQKLYDLIYETRPKVILAFGELPMLALLGLSDVAKWRGSELKLQLHDFTCTVIPTFDASAVIKNWPYRAVVLHDIEKRVIGKLARGWDKPAVNIKIAPTRSEALVYLMSLKDQQRVAVDVETVKYSAIDCIGFATSPTEAVCIPILHRDGTEYWSPEDKEAITLTIQQTLKRIRIIGQNFNYDAQYIRKLFGVTVYADFDTLSAQHVMYPGTPKALDYLASLYCDHYEYWKDENKNWTGKEKVDDEKRWYYNGTDCLRTFEIADVQEQLIKALKFEKQLEIQRKTDRACFNAMCRGLLVNKDMKHELSEETKAAIKARELRLNEIAGYEVNPRSPVQVKAMFKAKGIKLPTKMGKESTDKEALQKMLDKEGETGELAALLIEIRSLGTLSSNVINAKLIDGKYITSLNACGAETFRLSSSKSAFDTGGNAQNITDGSRGRTNMPVPNLRKLMIPPEGKTFWEADQQRADVQVVAWEADDAELKQMFRENADLHTENAKALFGVQTVTKPQRDKGKTFVHLTDYGGKARTCATKCGLLVAEAERLQKRWFEIHPGIKEWQKRIEAQLKREHCVYNKFGFRRYYFDRLDGLLGQALAWIPQSTVALVDNMAWHILEEEEDEDDIAVLLQVHDSLAGVYETSKEGVLIPRIQQAFLRVVVPYDDPLVIGVDLKTSTVSWGDCKAKEWAE